MEEQGKILELLAQLTQQMKGFDKRFDRLEENQAVIEYQLSEIKTRLGRAENMLDEGRRDGTVLKQGQAKLQMDLRDVKEDVGDLKYELKQAWRDIGSNEKRIRRHEEEYHTV